MQKPKIVIGFLSNQKAESVSIITQYFIKGLANQFNMIPLYCNRKKGFTTQSRFNVLNLYYFINHFSSWCLKLIVHKPKIAHYPMTSFWNFEKSMVFLLVAKISGAKIIGHLHGGSFCEFWQSLSGMRKWYAEKLLRQLDCLIVLSDGWVESIKKTVPFLTNRIKVVNNPIDSGIANRANVTRDRSAVLAMGVMDSKKGVLDIVEAVKLMKKDIPFSVKLTGPEREPGIADKVKKMIRQFKIDDFIEVVGPVWGEDKIKLFNQCSILLLPSYVENFPVVIVEASATQMAIITTPVGAIPEYFHHGISAYFVSPGNCRELADRLEYLLIHQEKQIELGLNAYNLYLLKLCNDVSFRSLASIYRALLGLS